MKYDIYPVVTDAFKVYVNAPIIKAKDIETLVKEEYNKDLNLKEMFAAEHGELIEVNYRGEYTDRNMGLVYELIKEENFIGDIAIISFQEW